MGLSLKGFPATCCSIGKSKALPLCLSLEWIYFPLRCLSPRHGDALYILLTWTDAQAGTAVLLLYRLRCCRGCPPPPPQPPKPLACAPSGFHLTMPLIKSMQGEGDASAAKPLGHQSRKPPSMELDHSTLALSTVTHSRSSGSISNHAL